MNEIDRAEEQLRAAMLAGDADALDRLIADDLIFVDHAGSVRTKAQDLAPHRSGELRASLAGTWQGVPFTGEYRFTRLWRRRGSSWQVAVAHCSLVAEAGAGGA